MAIPDPVTTGLVIAGATQVAKQAQDFIAAAAGHPGESIGTILGNWNRRRTENVEAVGDKARLILLNLGVEPKVVPLKVIQPLLEAASLEDDSELQDVWANLLAYAADPRRAQSPTMFSQILQELSTKEVRFFESVIATALERMSGAVHADTVDLIFSRQDLVRAYASAGLARAKVSLESLKTDEEYWEHREEYIADGNDFDMALEIVLRNRLLREREVITNESLFILPDDATVAETGTGKPGYSFTSLGIAFLQACRGPALPTLFHSKGCFDHE